MTHTYSASGPGVIKIQQQLNVASATRLPRLSTDGAYGALTMGRVMEFQSQQKIGIDGAVGPETQRVLDAGTPVSAAPSGFCILVDLINNRLRAFQHGGLALDFKPIHGGSATDPSTRGVFTVYRRERHHTSSKFPIPPGNMDFALFYHGAEALHQGPPTVPSHGCIHVEPSEAEKLFNWAKASRDIMVIVLKLKA